MTGRIAARRSAPSVRPPLRFDRFTVVLVLAALLGAGARAASATTTGADPALWRGDAFAGDLLFRYNRVDGATPGARLRFEAPSGLVRRAALEIGWAGARGRVRGVLSGAHALDARGFLSLHAAGWVRTAGFAGDEERMGNLENTLSSLLAGDDNRDHLDARGGEFGADVQPTDLLRVGAALRHESQRPLTVAAEDALFGDDPFRENPAATRGTLTALRIEASYDARRGLTDEGAPFLSRQRRPRGWRARTRIETAGQALGGTFRHTTAALELGVWLPVGPGHALAARLEAARAIGGRLTPQAEFSAGGAATLRGHRLKAFRGDRLALATIEYSAPIYRALEGLALFDCGGAWRSDVAPDGIRMALDGGAGLQTHDQRLRLLVARDVRRAAAPWLVSLRTRATF